ncbi:MAG: UDP-N-acetylglucosamine--LPS N-acetylglucosamine transferase [Candidatus Aminicenantes bacterium]|nr:UDP-N-acetylglucosamine--LPS N-acetylglucosamine transferase [Candidatus Aminicenantes bacterium]
MKVCLVASSGGHLYQLYVLQPWWSRHERCWVTFKKPDALSLLKEERVSWAYFPTTRNVKNLVRNFYLALKILRKEKPDVIISTGAGVALPFFFLGKLFGSRVVFIEVFDRITSPTLTGKLVYPLSDLFILQWPEQKMFYPKGRLLGRLL